MCMKTQGLRPMREILAKSQVAKNKRLIPLKDVAEPTMCMKKQGLRGKLRNFGEIVSYSIGTSYGFRRKNGGRIEIFW